MVMLSAALGFLGSIIYGASDFLGGLAAGRIRAEKVTAITSVVGLVLLTAITPIFGATFTSEAVFWGSIAGVIGAIAIVLLYACLAIGPMSILAPIMALVSAIVPITIAFVRGERLSLVGYFGLALGLVAVLLICFVPGTRVVRPAIRGVLFAVGAGVAVGLYLFFIDLSPSGTGLASLIVVFAVSAALTGVAVLIRWLTGARAPVQPPAPRFRGGVALAVYAGVTDAAASALFLAALRLGDLSVVSVLSAMSPAGTILLAAVVLRERVAAVQWIGFAVALIAAALLALV
jgi:drug/metabolite transporter (DMT)-like permease